MWQFNAPVTIQPGKFFKTFAGLGPHFIVLFRAILSSGPGSVARLLSFFELSMYSFYKINTEMAACRVNFC